MHVPRTVANVSYVGRDQRHPSTSTIRSQDYGAARSSGGSAAATDLDVDVVVIVAAATHPISRCRCSDRITARRDW